jgi:hypothetical protein
MPVVKVDVDPETYARLADQAVAERRPIVWQAEVELRRALGLPFPYQGRAGADGGVPRPAA